MPRARSAQTVEFTWASGPRRAWRRHSCCRWFSAGLAGGERPNDGPTRSDIARDLDALKLKKALGEVWDRQAVLDTWDGAYTRLGVALEQLSTKIGRELNLPGEDVKMVREMTDDMRKQFVEDCGEFATVPEAQPATAKDERAIKTA